MGNTSVVRTVRYLNAILLKVIKCYNYRREGNYAKLCTTKKRVKDSEWFKEKMLLAQQQDARIEIDAEQQDFLVDGLEGFDSDCKDLQLNATSILMTEKVDAYDSEVDDAPTASAIFMAKLSPVGSINGDEVGPSYDSDIISKIVEIVLLFLDFGCSKHMTGQQDKFINFVSKFISTVEFGNDHLQQL
ncbi:hypothetical protein Tco_1313077 [Tanacetum coccineum]